MVDHVGAVDSRWLEHIEVHVRAYDEEKGGKHQRNENFKDGDEDTAWLENPVLPEEEKKLVPSSTHL